MLTLCESPMLWYPYLLTHKHISWTNGQLDLLSRTHSVVIMDLTWITSQDLSLTKFPGYFRCYFGTIVAPQWTHFRLDWWTRDRSRFDRSVSRALLLYSLPAAAAVLTEISIQDVMWLIETTCVTSLLWEGIQPIQWVKQGLYYNQYPGTVALDLSFTVSGGLITGVNPYHTSTITLPGPYNYHSITMVMKGGCDNSLVSDQSSWMNKLEIWQIYWWADSRREIIVCCFQRERLMNQGLVQSSSRQTPAHQLLPTNPVASWNCVCLSRTTTAGLVQYRYVAPMIRTPRNSSSKVYLRNIPLQFLTTIQHPAFLDCAINMQHGKTLLSHGNLLCCWFVHVWLNLLALYGPSNLYPVYIGCVTSCCVCCKCVK